MPSSGPEGWQDRLFDDLSRHERERGPSGLRSSEEIPEIPRYEVLERIGQGATSVVYRARDRELNRPVALKVLRESAELSDVARQRFRRESQAAASLSHPNVVTVHDAGEAAGQLYLVMELVEGRPLSALLKEGGLPLPRLLELLEKSARGVAAAHGAGIVHRDLKPANILVTAAGEPKVADFGLAHLVDSKSELTRTGSSLGTPLYMSPEQVEGRAGEITPRTDVYSLGSILYEFLTGRPPHVGETTMEIYGKIVHEEPEAPRKLHPKLPRELETVALKALDKDPRRRYPGAGEFADDLRRYLNGEPVQARPAGLATRISRRLRKSRLAFSGAIVLAAVLVSAAAIGLTGRAEREKRLGLLREHARLSLEAALRLRRAGSNAAMRDFLPGLETAYAQALESAPDAAEVEYLMGRMHRALMDDEKALDFQERALRKEPEYAPALYERAVLMAAQYGSRLVKAVAQARRLPAGPVTARAAREVPLPEPGEVESRQDELVALREAILGDCDDLQRRLPSDRARRVKEAHVLTVKGILAFHRREFAKARELAEAAVKEDPTLEEAWSTLCTAATRQASLRESQVDKFDELLALHDEAEALYGRAISNDAGYVPHWIGRAWARRNRALFLDRRGKDSLPALAAAEEDVTRALGYTRQSAEAWFLRANVRDLTGVFRMDRGQDPTRFLDGAEEDLSEGLALFPGHPTLLLTRGGVRNHRALHRIRSGSDPLKDFASAEEDLREALRLDPASPEVLNSTAYVKLQRASWRKDRGQDPLPDLAAAEKDLDEVLRLARQHMVAWINRGKVRTTRALYRTGRGEPALDDLAKAEEDFSEAIRLAPAYSEAWLRRGSLRGHLGRLREREKDADKASRCYADSIADFKRAFDLRPTLERANAAELAEVEKGLSRLRPE